MERQKEVMTLREASEYLGISPDTLYKYLSERKDARFPAFKLGNRWRFKKDLLDRWMERKSERTASYRVEPSREAEAIKGIVAEDKIWLYLEVEQDPGRAGYRIQFRQGRRIDESRKRLPVDWLCL